MPGPLEGVVVTELAALGPAPFAAGQCRHTADQQRLVGILDIEAGGDDGIWVVDMSDPSNPSLVGHLDTPGSARRLAVQGPEARAVLLPAGLGQFDPNRLAQDFLAPFQSA